MNLRKKMLLVSAIIGAVLALRLTGAVVAYRDDPRRTIAPDSFRYIRNAWSIAKNGVLSNSLQEHAPPETFRTPGYPLFLAAVYATRGKSNLGVIIIQVSCCALTWLLLAVGARRLWDSRVAIAAILLSCFDCVSYIYSQQILTETLFTCFLTAALLAWINLCCASSQRSVWASLLGLSLACATLTRPVSYYLPIIMLAGIMARARQLRLSLQEQVRIMLALMLPLLLIVGGWQARNYYLTGSWALSDTEAYNMLMDRGARIIAKREGFSVDEARERIAAGLPPVAGLSRLDRNRLYIREGLAIMRLHPRLALQTHLQGMLNMLPGPGLSCVYKFYGFDSSRDHPLRDLMRLSGLEFCQKWFRGYPLLLFLFFIAYGFFIVLYAGLVRAVWSLAGEGREMLLCHVIIACMLLYLFIATGPMGYYRFAVPVLPIFILYASRGTALLANDVAPVMQRICGSRSGAA